MQHKFWKTYPHFKDREKLITKKQRQQHAVENAPISIQDIVVCSEYGSQYSYGEQGIHTNTHKNTALESEKDLNSRLFAHIQFLAQPATAYHQIV